MLLQTLKRFDDFAPLDTAALRIIARDTQLLSVPAGRVLLQPGRRLQGRFYLQRGELFCAPPGRVLQAGTAAARQAIVAGRLRVVTRTPVQLLHVDFTAAQALLDLAEQPSGALLPEAGGSGWEQQFLGSRLMRRLAPAQWQRVLRAMTALCCAAGQRIIRQGETGGTFYVLARGHAVVHRGTRTLRFLNPGDFFGEDALICGGRRNADVTLLEQALLMGLPRAPFLRLLVALVVRPAPGTGLGVPINVGGTPLSGVRHLPIAEFREAMNRLDPAGIYCMVGGTVPERALAAFLLAQAGIRAYVLPAAPSGGSGRHSPLAGPGAQLGDALGSEHRHGIGAVDRV